MSEKTFNIYCDESTHLPRDNKPYMILGCINVAYPQIRLIKEQIKAIKQKHNFNGELKWSNVHEATFSMYSEIVEYFFLTDMKFRAVIVDKSKIDENLPEYTFNDFYFRMYFQLLHQHIDLEYNYNVYFDIKDTCSIKKLEKLKDILKWNASIQNFQFIRSHESIFMQIADVLMGAINYNLRIKKEDILGKVIAKRKIVKKIEQHSNISLNATTPLSNKKFNLFFISLK
jgi:hypothetical protein